MFELFFGLNNYSAIDDFSLRHLASGMVVGLMLYQLAKKHPRLRRSRRFILLGIMPIYLWEVFEIFLRYVKFSGSYDKLYLSLARIIDDSTFSIESRLNIYSDIILDFLGLMCVYWLYIYLADRQNK